MIKLFLKMTKNCERKMKKKKINFFISKEKRKISMSRYLAIFADFKNVFIFVLAVLVMELRHVL